MLDKTYQPAAIEPRIHAEWDAAEAFKCGNPDRLNFIGESSWLKHDHPKWP